MWVSSPLVHRCNTRWDQLGPICRPVPTLHDLVLVYGCRSLRYKASWSRKKEIFGQDSDQLCVIARLNSDLETKLKGSSVGELV